MSFASLEARAACDRRRRRRRGAGRAHGDRSSPPAGGFGDGAGYADGPRRGDLGRAAGAAPRRARDGARAACRASSATALAQIHSVDAAAVEGLAGRPATRRSQRARSGRRRSTRSASRCRRSRLGCAGCGSTPPPPAERRARPRRLPARQLHRRRARARGGDRLGAVPPRRPGRGHRLAVHPLLAVRQRRSPGRRARRARASSSPPTRPPAGRGPSRTGCAGGRRWATSSGR